MNTANSKLSYQFLKQQVKQHKTIDKNAFLLALNLLKNEDLRQQLFNLACPTSMILGEQDQLIPQTIRLKLPDTITTQLLPNTNHAPFISQPKTFLTTLNEILL